MGSVAREQLKAFLVRMQDDAVLKQQVLAAATADDVAQIALKLGFEFSGDELTASPCARTTSLANTTKSCDPVLAYGSPAPEAGCQQR